MTRPGGSFSLCLSESAEATSSWPSWRLSWEPSSLLSSWPQYVLLKDWAKSTESLESNSSTNTRHCLMPLSRISGVWAEATSRMSPHPHTRGLKLLFINLRVAKLFLQHALTLILRLPRKSSRGNAPPRAIFVEKVFGPWPRERVAWSARENFLQILILAREKKRCARASSRNERPTRNDLR